MIAARRTVITRPYGETQSTVSDDLQSRYDRYLLAPQIIAYTLAEPPLGRQVIPTLTLLHGYMTLKKPDIEFQLLLNTPW